MHGGGAQAAAPPGGVRGRSPGTAGEDKVGGSRQGLAAAARVLTVKPSGLQCVRDFSFKKFRNGLGGGLGWAGDRRVLQSKEPVPGQGQGWGR